MPRVSLITALHNKGPHIDATIRSVIAQSVADWEMIVVENHSSDNGPETVEAIVKKEPRLRLVRAPATTRGPGAARNIGLDHAKGDWVLFLDADDLIEPRHLESLLATAEAFPAAQVIAGGWREFTSSPADASPKHVPSAFGRSREVLLARSTALAPWVLHAAIIRNSSLTARNRWPEHLDLYPDEDTAFWFPVLTDSEVAWHNECGALYRKLPQGSRSNSGTLMERIEGYTKIVAHNFTLAKERNIHIEPCASCSVSMMYEVSYRKAVEAGDAAARALSLKSATDWLRRCDAKNWNTVLRKLIGIRAVNFLRKTLR